MPELRVTPIDIVKPDRQVEAYPGEGLGIYAGFVDKDTYLPPKPGDIFYAAHQLEDPYRHGKSESYWTRPEPRRLPIVVVLPGLRRGYWFCVDDAYCSDGKLYGGWTVTKDDHLETVTVTPSINCVGLWHGWLTDGVLRW